MDLISVYSNEWTYMYMHNETNYKSYVHNYIYLNQ